MEHNAYARLDHSVNLSIVAKIVWIQLELFDKAREYLQLSAISFFITYSSLCWLTVDDLGCVNYLYF